jgi:hypothetical protein
MNKIENKVVKDASVKTKIAGNGRKAPLWKNYGAFVVNQALYGRSQIDRLWEEILSLQHAVSKLQKNN